MKVSASIVAMSLFGLAAATESESEMGVNPIRRVVTLMQEMQKEVEAEGETEKELFEKFMCYCKGNNGDLKKKITESASTEEAMKCKVESETGEKKQVDEELAAKKKERTECKADYDKKQKMRAKEAAEYAESSADAKANLEATYGAIKALEAGMGASFLQTTQGAAIKKIIAVFADKETMDMDDKETVSAFLQGDYTPASGQIVGILKNMADEMEKDIAEAGDAEAADIKGHDELCAAKKKEFYACTDAVESLTKRSGELAVSIVQNKNAMEDAAEENADATEFLANLEKNCAERTKEHDENSVTRAQEVEAISKAIAILNEDDALDLFKKTLKTPEVEKPVEAEAFLQKSVKKGSALSKVKALLECKKSQSPAVALLQSTVMSQIKEQAKFGNKGDFSKVNKMIDDMISLLGQEQKDDEESQKWCTSEFDKSDDTKKSLTKAVKSLASSISQCEDEIASLSEQIQAKEDSIKALDKSVAEASEQRKKENSEFTAEMSANNMAIELIGKAKNKLLQFYNPDLAVTETEPEKTMGDELAESFVQLQSQVAGKQAPETAKYSKKSQGGQTIVALMDKLIRELEVSVQECDNMEKSCQKEYEELLADAEKTKKEDTKCICDKRKAKADIEETLGEEKREHSLKSTSLAETKTYISDLHRQCDFILAEFDNRKEARGAEVEGLKKAKAVLAGADYKFF